MRHMGIGLPFCRKLQYFAYCCCCCRLFLLLLFFFSHRLIAIQNMFLKLRSFHGVKRCRCCWVFGSFFWFQISPTNERVSRSANFPWYHDHSNWLRWGRATCCTDNENDDDDDFSCFKCSNYTLADTHTHTHCPKSNENANLTICFDIPIVIVVVTEYISNSKNCLHFNL